MSYFVNVAYVSLYASFSKEYMSSCISCIIDNQNGEKQDNEVYKF